MRKSPLLITAGLALFMLTSRAARADAPSPPLTCNGHVFVHITTATDTLLVQGVLGQRVKFCGVKNNFVGSAAQSTFIENTASVNANCSSANTQIGNLVTGSATAPSVDQFYDAFWAGMANTMDNGVCAHTSGTGPLDVEIWFNQSPN